MVSVWTLIPKGSEFSRGKRGATLGPNYGFSRDAPSPGVRKETRTPAKFPTPLRGASQDTKLRSQRGSPSEFQWIERSLHSPA
jgi:hypothetical protein